MKETTLVKPTILTVIITTVIITIIRIVIQSVRSKVYKPAIENNVQKPGTLERVIANVLLFISIFSLFFAIIGFIMAEMEMGTVFTVMSVIFISVTILIKRAHNMSYQETDTYFILQTGKQSQKVYYENIVDWEAGYNEIEVLDQMNVDGKYVRVNIKIFAPEILLRKLADMTFEGKFYQEEQVYMNDPNRKVEFIRYLTQNKYGYLVEDYIKQIENNYI